MKNKRIRDFIYIDKDRLNSLYSQTFEGVIQAVAESYSSELEQDESTTSPLKGQSIESRVAEATTKTESKILYDHMYNLLEDQLREIIFDINQLETVHLDDLRGKTIIKITGRAVIHDYDRLSAYLDKFNELGLIIAGPSYNGLDSTERKNMNLGQYAKSKGLQQDKGNLNNIKTMTQFFNNGGYDVVISLPNSDDIIYRGVVNKAHLRNEPNMIRTLYGDEPPMNWSMVGQITYLPDIESGEEAAHAEDISSAEKSISDSYQNVFRSYRAVEKDFFMGKAKKRVHIAPIAIYTETEWVSERDAIEEA